jgi:hypothetical protein
MCPEDATHHVTEIVEGKAVEYHLCDLHLRDQAYLKPGECQPRPAEGFAGFMCDPLLREAIQAPAARQKVAAHQLPALCLALLDSVAEVRVAAAFQMMLFGQEARSALGALRQALHDPDERVRKAAARALGHIESEKRGSPFA